MIKTAPRLDNFPDLHQGRNHASYGICLVWQVACRSQRVAGGGTNVAFCDFKAAHHKVGANIIRITTEDGLQKRSCRCGLVHGDVTLDAFPTLVLVLIHVRTEVLADSCILEIEVNNSTRCSP